MKDEWNKWVLQMNKEGRTPQQWIDYYAKKIKHGGLTAREWDHFESMKKSNANIHS
jgi:hypothetical protein